MTTPVFELKNIDYYFDHKQVLENINIKINKGEFLAIVGPNGAGKSTLLKIILGLLSHLMMNNLLNVLLNSICYYFVEDFCISIHQ